MGQQMVAMLASSSVELMGRNLVHLWVEMMVAQRAQPLAVMMVQMTADNLAASLVERLGFQKALLLAG